MDRLKGNAWVAFVSDCIADIMKGQRLFGRSGSIVIVIRNRWNFVNRRHGGRKCIANDN